MKNVSQVSPQTRTNWLVDAGLLISGTFALLTGVYFLYLPQAGFQGGRNPAHQIQILFSRHTWDDLHTWSGVAMILVAAVHLARHWPWVVNMARRTWNELTGKCGCMNWRGRGNLILNSLVATAFLVTAISGLYFLLAPGTNRATGPSILFSPTTWDLIHTWSGVSFVFLAGLHLLFHWKWVSRVTHKIAAQVLSAHPSNQPVWQGEK